MTSRVVAFWKGKESPLTQFIKYVICGGTSVVVDMVAFYLLAWLVFPCLGLRDPVARLIQWVGFSVQEVSADELKRNYWIIKGICFLLSNAVVYTLNVLFVFKSGRHSRPLEILLFFGSSLFQFFFIWLGAVLITVFNWEVTYSNITMLMISLLVNFVVRKNVVFKN